MSYTTVWTIRGDLWNRIAKVLPPDKAPSTPGRPALPNPQVLNGILYVLRTGCHWKSLKKEWFGAGSSWPARYQAWRAAGLFARIFQIMLEYYAHVKRIQWRWQALDRKSGPAPLGGGKTGKNPTDRGKLGSKRHLLVDGRGAPLAIVVSGAHAHDKTCAVQVLEAGRVPRPQRQYRVQHWCADKGYDFDDIRQAIYAHHYQVHIKAKGLQVEAVPPEKPYLARRWVVERTLSWQNDFRNRRVRWSKNPDNWLAFIPFASALVLRQMATNS